MGLNVIDVSIIRAQYVSSPLSVMFRYFTKRLIIHYGQFSYYGAPPQLGRTHGPVYHEKLGSA